MITLENGNLQNCGGLIVPNGSVAFQLTTDATIIASPYGIIPAQQVVIFQFDDTGNLVQPAQLWSNAELNPQNSDGLGTQYLVTFYDANGARINKSPMMWLFTEPDNSTVNIGEMTAVLSSAGGNVIFYPSFTVPTPGPSTLGGVAVVFVEGGPATYTLSEVETGSYNAQADDLKYWQIVFATFGAEKNFNFRAVGSKATIKELASLITGHQISHVFAAMDRDFENLTGTLPTGPGVFSTLGHSWENDVWRSEVVFSTFKKFNNAPQVETAAKTLTDEEFKRIQKKLKPCVRVDAVLAVNKVDVLPRAKFTKIIRPAQARNKPPQFASQVARQLISARKSSLRPQKVSAPALNISVCDDCCGHVMGHFGYHLLVHVLRKFCKFRTTPRDLLVPASIDAFAAQLATDDRLRTHFTSLFALTSTI